MYKDVLRSIGNAEIFPVVAICVFIVFFIGLIIYVVKMDKGRVDELAALPLNDYPHTEPPVSAGQKPTHS